MNHFYESTLRLVDAEIEDCKIEFKPGKYVALVAELNRILGELNFMADAIMNSETRVTTREDVKTRIICLNNMFYDYISTVRREVK